MQHNHQHDFDVPQEVNCFTFTQHSKKCVSVGLSHATDFSDTWWQSFSFETQPLIYLKVNGRIWAEYVVRVISLTAFPKEMLSLCYVPMGKISVRLFCTIAFDENYLNAILIYDSNKMYIILISALHIFVPLNLFEGINSLSFEYNHLMRWTQTT